MVIITSSMLHIDDLSSYLLLGTSTSDTVLASWTGYVYFGEVESTGQDLLVKFTPDYSVQYSGFVLQYEEVPVGKHHTYISYCI